MYVIYVCVFIYTHTHTQPKLPNTCNFKSVNMKPIP